MDTSLQKFLVLGVSKSGSAVVEYLLSKGAKCYIYEELNVKSAQNAVIELTKKGAIQLNKENVDKFLVDIDVLVISPGVPINHDIAIKMKELKKRIVGEFEFGFLSFNPKTVAVTGTNGKTTTVSMINHILRSENLKSALVGNIGVPITSKINEIDKDTICVCEVSSFQLETISSFCPHIACILNVSPDHLERHYTLENYVFLKNRLIFSQKESEYAVLNYDDSTVREMANTAKSKVVFVSAIEKTNGAYALGDDLYYKEEKITSVNELSVKGMHNVYNALFSIAVAKLLGVSNETIKSSLASFKGVPHRIELIKEINGIKYYNDSKSTNTNSTITAIRHMSAPTVLIIGGCDKGEDYTELFNTIKNSNIVHTVITGSSRIKMLKCALDNGITEISLSPDFNLAIRSALAISKNTLNVLFSPACSSYDCFSNFEERGNAFIKAINEIID